MQERNQRRMKIRSHFYGLILRLAAHGATGQHGRRHHRRKARRQNIQRPRLNTDFPNFLRVRLPGYFREIVLPRNLFPAGMQTIQYTRRTIRIFFGLARGLLRSPRIAKLTRAGFFVESPRMCWTRVSTNRELFLKTMLSRERDRFVCLKKKI